MSLHIFGRPASQRAIEAGREITELILPSAIWTQDVQIRLESLVLALDMKSVRILGFDSPVMSDARYTQAVREATQGGTKVSAFVHVNDADAAARALPGATFRFGTDSLLNVRGNRFYSGEYMVNVFWDSLLRSPIEPDVWHRHFERFSVLDRFWHVSDYVEKTFDMNPGLLVPAQY